MLWKVDESFQVTTTKQLAGQPETTSTIKVIWNEMNNNDSSRISKYCFRHPASSPAFINIIMPAMN